MRRGSISRIRLDWIDAVGGVAIVAMLIALAEIYWPLAVIAGGSGVLWAISRLEGSR